jgi:hypothetical protein
MIAPIIPYRDVDAPAFTILSEGFVRHVKIFPPIPEITKIISVFHHPNVYSTRLTNIKIVSTLPKK